MINNQQVQSEEMAYLLRFLAAADFNYLSKLSIDELAEATTKFKNLVSVMEQLKKLRHSAGERTTRSMMAQKKADERKARMGAAESLKIERPEGDKPSFKVAPRPMNNQVAPGLAAVNPVQVSPEVRQDIVANPTLEQVQRAYSGQKVNTINTGKGQLAETIMNSAGQPTGRVY